MADEHHGEKELAAFIRASADRRPEQAFGDYYRGKSASCALGAAYEGMYRLPNEAGGDGCKKTLSLASILVPLNDEHRWSREQIAGWLDTHK